MKSIKKFFQRHLISAPLSFGAWLYFMLGTSLTFLPATGLFFAIYFSSNFAMKQLQINSIIKEFGISRSEYRYIENQLNNANKKLKKLNSYYGKVRSFQAFRLLHEMNLISRRIMNTVKTNPQKFYYVENFFYSHLDSAVELTSKYAMLVNQPLKDDEVKKALGNTRSALNNVNQQLEQDLRDAYANDIETLKIELDYVNVMMKRNNAKARLEMKGDSEHE